MVIPRKLDSLPSPRQTREVRIFIRIAVASTALAPLYAQYGGPALLTRGQAPTGMNAAQIDFRPFLTIDAGWDDGLNGVSIDPNGNPVNVSGVSVDASLGLSG